MAGSVRSRSVPPSAMTFTLVGTECSPSATTDRSRWSRVRGPSNWYSSQEPAWSPKWFVQAVVGSASTVAEARSARAPWSRPEDRAASSPLAWVPSIASSCSSGRPAASRAWPERAKVRAVGRLNERAIVSSSSLEVGSLGSARSRDRRMLRSLPMEAGPAAVSRSVGRFTTSSTRSPATSISEMPTALAFGSRDAVVAFDHQLQGRERPCTAELDQLPAGGEGLVTHRYRLEVPSVQHHSHLGDDASGPGAPGSGRHGLW